MLLQGGYTKVDKNWIVDEQTGTGYSRVYRIYSGEVEYRDKFEKKMLKHDKIYIFPDNAPYSMTTNPHNTLVCTFIHIDIHPAMLKRLVCLDTDGTHGAIFNALYYAYLAHEKLVLTHLADAFIASCIESGTFERPSSFIATVYDFIANNYSTPLSIKQISAHFGYNQQYFIRRFKSETGTTPYQYLLDYRLKEASLLLKKDFSISEIAISTGFKDSKTFCRAFSRRYGISPGRFRKLTLIVP